MSHLAHRNKEATKDEDEEEWEDYLEKKGKTMQMERLQAMKIRFIDPPDKIFDNPERKVYHEGTLHRHTRFKTMVRRCVVMSDMLVFAKLVKDKYQIKQVLDIRKITLNNHVKGLRFGFVVQTQEQQYVLAALSETERVEWVKLITQAIVDLKNKEGGMKNPLDGAMQHLQGLLKAEEDPVVQESVKQVLELLDSVKKNASVLNTASAKKSILRKKMDKNIKNQAPDVAAWLKDQFLSAPSSGGKENESSVSRANSSSNQRPEPQVLASQRIANLFLESAKKAKASKTLRRLLGMMQRRRRIECQLQKDYARNNGLSIPSTTGNNTSNSTAQRNSLSVTNGSFSSSSSSTRGSVSKGGGGGGGGGGKAAGGGGGPKFSVIVGVSDEEVNRILYSEVQQEQKLASPFHQIQFQLSGWVCRMILRRSENWDLFDVWRLDECTMGRPLSCLAWHLFAQYGFFEKFNIKQLDFARFITAIEDGYNEVPYHNRLHATDVLQNIACFLSAPSFKQVVSAVDVMSAFVAAAIHDFRHPGTTNLFHINAETDVALTFNDISVLESMHSAEAFKVMRTAGFDILAGTPVSTRKEARETIITMVLATDMKKHFELHQELHDYVDFKNAEAAAAAAAAAADGSPVTSPPNSPTNQPAEPKKPPTKTAPRLLYLQAAMHCADLGNPAKPLPFYLKWTDLIMIEFFAQGDRERDMGLPISPMCDRTKPAIEKTQIGFISVIVKPLFATFTKLITEMGKTLNHLDDNQHYWQEELNKNSPPPPATAAATTTATATATTTATTTATSATTTTTSTTTTSSPPSPSPSPASPTATATTTTISTTTTTTSAGGEKK